MTGSIKVTYGKAAAAAPSIAKPPRDTGRKCQKKKRPAPFPVRLSNDERAILEARAGSRPLGAYIRETLLGDAQTARKRTKAKPKADYALLAQVLGQLGQSDQVRCLFLLLVAAENSRVTMGAAERAALLETCDAVKDMRGVLISALGLKS